MDFYHDLVTQKSWQLLQDLRRRFNFILIGGWAVFLYTHALKSKDIDLVAEHADLEKLRQEFAIYKNDRLKKYEARSEEVEVDIYVPYYSNPGLPAEDLKNYVLSLEGFKVVEKEVLAILKQKALLARAGTAKGKKDLIDLIGLFRLGDFNWEKYRNLAVKYGLEDSLRFTHKTISQAISVEELGLNRHQFSRFKRKILPFFSSG
ncbi:hypothetical protein HYU92_06450 [Candidatus Curtissbacteria bacterium]|nr:hypothetical protein [Candidatus Curtissbacteria bacterium]